MSDIAQLNSRIYAINNSPTAVSMAPAPIDWDRVRVDAAITALQSLLTVDGACDQPSTIAEHAVCMANKLVAELKKEAK